MDTHGIIVWPVIGAVGWLAGTLVKGGGLWPAWRLRSALSAPLSADGWQLGIAIGGGLISSTITQPPGLYS